MTDMNKSDAIARLNRKRILEIGGASDVVYVATSSANILYCSGFRSMGYDTDPKLQFAAVFNEEHTILVGPISDLWNAYESCSRPLSYYGYGRFFFEHEQSITDNAVDFRAFPDFASATKAAIDELSGDKCRVAADADYALETTARFLSAEVATQIFRSARSIKSAGEISALREVTKHTEDALESALRTARSGVSETEIAAEISAAMYKSGMRPGFIVVTSGPRSAFADAYASRRILEPGDLVRIDVGGTLDGYWSDTACSAIVGDHDEVVARVNDALLAGQAIALDQAMRRRPTNEIFDATVNAVRKSGLPEYQRHHVGHGIGVESHEYPTISSGATVELVDGMIINVETPYYRPGWGGIMYEDTLIVANSKVERITRLENRLIRLPA